MKTSYQPFLVVALGLLALGVSAWGGDGQTLPSPYYLNDDVQYFPSATDKKLEAASPAKGGTSALGELLFTDVVSVHYIGPGRPANPDGSYGGKVADDGGMPLRIYQRFIVQDARSTDGTTLRTLYAYDKIGKIEQRLGERDTKAN